MLLFQQYFLLKNFCEIVTNLLEDLLHQGRACTVTAKKKKKEAASRLQKGRPAEILQIKQLTC